MKIRVRGALLDFKRRVMGLKRWRLHSPEAKTVEKEQ
jgi:hypothetical protein